MSVDGRPEPVCDSLGPILNMLPSLSGSEGLCKYLRALTGVCRGCVSALASPSIYEIFLNLCCSSCEGLLRSFQAIEWFWYEYARTVELNRVGNAATPDAHLERLRKIVTGF